MKLIVMCLLSAFLTIAAETSLLSAQAAGRTRVDTESGLVVNLLHLR